MPKLLLTPFIVCVGVMHMCISVYVWVGMQRPEVDVDCLPGSLFMLFLEAQISLFARLDAREL